MGEVLPTYFHALTLVRRNTPETMRVFAEAQAKDPELAWAHMAMAFVYPKYGGWHRGKRPKQLKRHGISTAAHFTLLVTIDFVATACRQMAKWR